MPQRDASQASGGSVQVHLWCGLGGLFYYPPVLAHRHPACWAVDSSGDTSLAREGAVLLDLAAPPAGRQLAGALAGLVGQTGMDGLGRGPESVYGPAGVTGLGRGPVQQVRSLLAPGQPLSVAVEADPDRALAWHYDWPGWADAGLVETVILRGLEPEPTRLTGQIQQARARCSGGSPDSGGRVRLVAQLDCWRPTLALHWPCTSPAASTGGQHGRLARVGLRQPEALVQAARVALAAGADEVGVYRADAVEAQVLHWPCTSPALALRLARAASTGGQHGWPALAQVGALIKEHATDGA